MDWILLFIAGLLEIFWAYQLKCSQGFSKLLPSILTLLGMGVSFYLLSYAMKTLPLGSSYAVWTGIGIVGSAIVGILIFKEPTTIPQLLCIACIIAGIAGLNLLSGK